MLRWQSKTTMFYVFARDFVSLVCKQWLLMSPDNMRWKSGAFFLESMLAIEKKCSSRIKKTLSCNQFFSKKMLRNPQNRVKLPPVF